MSYCKKSGMRRGSVFNLRRSENPSSQAAEKQGLVLTEWCEVAFGIRAATRMPLLNYSSTTLEAEAGIERLKRRFQSKNAQFYAHLKLTLSLLGLTLSVHPC
jgi:hypothetical protein